MKFIKVIFLFSIILHFFSCRIQEKKIYHLQDTYDAEFYVFDGYEDNSESIKYLISFSEKNRGYFFVLTNKNEVYFDDGVYWFKKEYQRAVFDKKTDGNAYKSMRINFLQSTLVHFSIKDVEDQKQLIADFDSLTVNTVQNFLDYAKKDDTKKEKETYSYMLLNKNKVEKMKLIYHEYGSWFEVEVF